MIHVIGAGGTGGWLIPALLKMVDPHNLTVWDADIVEEKNLTRQNFLKQEVGIPKVEALMERLELWNVHARWFEENDEAVIYDGDTVIICADNFHIRALIDKISTQRDEITIINCGNEEITTSTQVYVVRNGVEYTPRITYMHDEIVFGATAAELACAVVANLPGGEQTVAANMTSAALGLMALTMVAKWDASPLRPPSRPPLPWHEFQTDMARGNAASIDWREDGIGEWKGYMKESDDA